MFKFIRFIGNGDLIKFIVFYLLYFYLVFIVVDIL